MLNDEEILVNQLLDAERKWPQRSAKEIEAGWPILINICATLLHLGPGPDATMTTAHFEEKMTEAVRLYEELYSQAAAGRKEFAKDS